MMMRCIAVSVAAGLTVVAADAQAPVDVAHLVLPAVPQAANVDQKTGFPTLPSVAQFMKSSTKALHELDAETTSLRAKIAKVQQANMNKMDKEKSVFDGKLRDQELENKKLENQNRVQAKAIFLVKGKSDNLLVEAKKLMKENGIRRAQLTVLKAQLTNLAAFGAESLKSADDSHAQEVQMLPKQKGKASKQKEKISLIQLSSREGEDDDSAEDAEPAANNEEQPSKAAPASSKAAATSASGQISVAETKDAAESDVSLEQPRALVELLKKSLEIIDKDNSDNSAALKSTFKEDFKLGTIRQQALLKQQSVLDETYAAIHAYMGKLQGAVAHLKKTQSALQKQVHESGEFLGKLSKITASKPEEAVARIASLQKK